MKDSPAVRERAARLVREQQVERASRWTVIASIAGKMALGPRHRSAELDRPSGRRGSERERLKQVKREHSELPQANGILCKASGYSD